MPDQKQTDTQKSAAKMSRVRKSRAKQVESAPLFIPSEQPPAPARIESTTHDPGSLLQMAVQSGNIAVIDRLVALYNAWQADKAKAAFVDALVNFQCECPTIKKTTRKTFKSENSGKVVTYNYAPFDSILDQTRDIRSKYKIAHRVELGHVASPEGKILLLTATVVIMHGAHEERTTLAAPPDMTGFKNDIQAEGSTIEYLRRYAFSAALGLSTADDLDGEKGKAGAVVENVLEQSVKACNDLETLKALMYEQNQATRTDPKVIGLFKAREKEISSKQ